MPGSRVRTILTAILAIALCILPLPREALAGSAAGDGGVTSVRIGYVPNWNVQSNIAIVLRMTNVMERLGLQPTFTSFVAGGPMNQAMLGNKIDVELIGGGPAVALVANGGQDRIVARISDVRDALIVKKDSPYKRVADLKGKTIGSFVGSNTYLVLVSLLQAAGLNPQRDVRIVNLSPNDDYNALMSGGIDAYDTWDPYSDLALEQGNVRILGQGNTAAPGVVVMSDAFLASHRSAAVRTLQSIAIATWYMARHKQAVNTWLARDTKLPLAVIARASAVDSNYRNAPPLDKVRLRLSKADIEGLDEVVEYFWKLKQIRTRPDMAKYVDQTVLAAALQKLAGSTEWSVALK